MVMALGNPCGVLQATTSKSNKTSLAPAQIGFTAAGGAAQRAAYDAMRTMRLSNRSDGR